MSDLPEFNFNLVEKSIASLNPLKVGAVRELLPKAITLLDTAEHAAHQSSSVENYLSGIKKTRNALQVHQDALNKIPSAPDDQLYPPEGSKDFLKWFRQTLVEYNAIAEGDADLSSGRTGVWRESVFAMSKWWQKEKDSMKEGASTLLWWIGGIAGAALGVKWLWGHLGQNRGGLSQAGGE